MYFLVSLSHASERSLSAICKYFICRVREVSENSRMCQQVRAVLANERKNSIIEKRRWRHADRVKYDGNSNGERTLLHDAEKKRAVCLEILYSLSEAFHLLCHIYEEVYDLSQLAASTPIECSCNRCVCVIKILNLRHVRSSSPSNFCKSTTRAMRSCWQCVSSSTSHLTHRPQRRLLLCQI